MALTSLLSSWQSASSSSWSSPSSWSSSDIEQYLAGYPRQRDDPARSDNLRFFRNELRSEPSGDFIDAIHSGWLGDYRRLEVHHGYIQWLFPLREEGMNSRIHPLQPHEAEAIQADPACMKRLLRSYELILDFWGFSLSSASTGAVRTVSAERVGNLVASTHNFLRVTRVLKSLGELGMEEVKLGFALRLWVEATGRRGSSGMKRSCEEYWMRVMKDADDRAIIGEVKAGRLDVSDDAVYERVLNDRAQQRRQRPSSPPPSAAGGAKGSADRPTEEKSVEEAARTDRSSKRSPVADDDATTADSIPAANEPLTQAADGRRSAELKRDKDDL